MLQEVGTQFYKNFETEYWIFNNGYNNKITDPLYLVKHFPLIRCSSESIMNEDKRTHNKKVSFIPNPRVPFHRGSSKVYSLHRTANS